MEANRVDLTSKYFMPPPGSYRSGKERNAAIPPIDVEAYMRDCDREAALTASKEPDLGLKLEYVLLLAVLLFVGVYGVLFLLGIGLIKHFANKAFNRYVLNPIRCRDMRKRLNKMGIRTC